MRRALIPIACLASLLALVVGMLLIYNTVMFSVDPGADGIRILAVGVGIGLLLPAGIMYLVDPGTNPSPGFHLFSGATILCAFFIATDPVSGCTSPRGRLIFGAGVGIITLLIRRWGGYPDGVAFAVLLMNMAAPLIDRYTRPRIFGQ